MAHLPSLQQLPLSLTLRDDCTLETFYPGANVEAFTQIKEIAAGTGEQFIYLWGREGVGRSHLLQGACHYAGLYLKTAFYLPLSDPKTSLSILEGLERIDLVCIDDIDHIAGNETWEEALFHLFNRIQSAQHRLLIAANCPPKALLLKLPDLKSRLTWGVTYQLQSLDDEQLLSALQLRAKQRGLELNDEVGAYLIRRCVRSMPELYEQLEKLDKASLAQQRRLTIPFVKEVLAL
ncbi:MAG: DnaA regulatory inactivator Hda [Candidatus Berkiellales bacterium]